MTISATIIAKCKKCGGEFEIYMMNLPFVDAEVTGTCDDCCVKEINKRISSLKKGGKSKKK